MVTKLPNTASEKIVSTEKAVQSKQRLRLRRLVMVMATYAVVTLATFLTTLLGLGEMNTAQWTTFIGLGLLGNSAFFVMLYTSANLHFSDPSLTREQIFYSALWGMVPLYSLPEARPIVLMFYLPAFSFGMLRLTQRQYLSMVAIVMGLYASLLGLEYFQDRPGFRIQYELFLFVLFGILLTWLALFGGFVSNIRRQLRIRNKEIQKSHEKIKTEFKERKEAEKKIEHLNRVLRAIRNVNQLITKEKDVEKLVQGTCSNLIENRGYQTAWIALLDENGGLLTTAEAGLGNDFLPLLERLKQGEFPECCQRALSESSVVIVEDKLSICGDCPLAQKYEGTGRMALRLEHGGTCYGLISISAPVGFLKESEEQNLFKEVAGDIAFALYSLEVEKEQKRAEEALRLQAEITANMSEGVCLTRDSDGVIAYVNPKFEDMFGYEPGELIGKHASIVNAPTDKSPEQTAREVMDIMEVEGVWSGEFNNIKKDCTSFWTYANVSYFDHPEHGSVLVSVHTDITENKQAEDRLRKSEEKYRTLFESSKEGIVSTNLQGYIVDANQAYLDMLDYSLEEIRQLTYQQLTPTKWHDMEADINENQLMTRGYSDEYEKEYIKKDGTIFPVVLKSWLTTGEQGCPAGTWVIVRDITESRKARIQLIEAEKMGAIGTLTAGIAHELNNPLMGMINFIQYCMEKSPSDSRVHDVLKDAEHETKRCIDIVKNLLTFSRIEKQEEEKYQRINIKVIFDRIFKLLAYRTVKENVEVTQHIEEGVPEIWIKPSNMQQVFLNLVGNALDALKESKQKALHIDIQSDTEFAQVTIKDTGPGISPDNLFRIFDPFFTTKPMGKGTGLGLSVSHGIVKDHGGEILCESELGLGTTFQVLLPVKRNEKRMEK